MTRIPSRITRESLEELKVFSSENYNPCRHGTLYGNDPDDPVVEIRPWCVVTKSGMRLIPGSRRLGHGFPIKYFDHWSVIFKKFSQKPEWQESDDPFYDWMHDENDSTRTWMFGK